jgi:hypothetical protein
MRRFRVSVYPPNVSVKSWPLVHKASRELRLAKGHFDHFQAKITSGEFGRVVLHQGKLYLGHSFKILMDSDWFKEVDYDPIKGTRFLKTIKTRNPEFLNQLFYL